MSSSASGSVIGIQPYGCISYADNSDWNKESEIKVDTDK